MDLETASVPPGDAGITGRQDAAQPEAILDAPEEVKVTPDLVTEVNMLVVEDFSQLTLDKGDAASGDPGETSDLLSPWMARNGTIKPQL